MTHINQRRDTAANWAFANPVLQLGEVGWEEDTRKSKLGDGVSDWNTLSYSVAEVDITAEDIGLGQVDNTSDLDKPVSTATATAIATAVAPKATTSDVNTALATKAPLDSPALTGNPTAPTPATADNDTSLATTAFVKAALLAMKPVGSVEINVSGVNPETYLGGTWVAWGSGRVPVGVDTSQTEFDTVEETGGEKKHTLTVAEMPAHDHGGATGSGGTHGHNIQRTVASGGAAGAGLDFTSGRYLIAGGYVENDGAHAHTVSAQGGDTAHNILQPYITCYMWKRTA